jgi:hypothetical protein
MPRVERIQLLLHGGRLASSVKGAATADCFCCIATATGGAGRLTGRATAGFGSALAALPAGAAGFALLLVWLA